MVLEITETEAASAASEGAAADGPTANGIRQVGDNRYLVDRGEVDHSIENLSTVVTQMRAVPYLKDGKSLGFRVFNIRSGSLFERMGLKNGDVIQAVNGTTSGRSDQSARVARRGARRRRDQRRFAS